MHKLTLLLLVVAGVAGCLSDGDATDPKDPNPNDSGTEESGMVGQEANQTGYTGFDGEPDDCAKILPPGPMALEPGVVTGYSTRVLDVVLAVDQSFVDRHGQNWTDIVDFIAVMADDVYQRELQLEVNVTAVIRIPVSYLHVEENTAGSLDGPQSQKILDDTPIYMDEYYADLDRDLVYTLVGNATAGAIAGQADCIGGARFKDVAYGWGEALDIDEAAFSIGPVSAFQYNSVKVILHEMAHILGAHHHYQVCGPAALNSIPEDSFGACSIMTNAVDFASFFFSPVNKAAIRGYADSVDL